MISSDCRDQTFHVGLAIWVASVLLIGTGEGVAGRGLCVQAGGCFRLLTFSVELPDPPETRQ